jgi:hypothetical protein
MADKGFLSKAQNYRELVLNLKELVIFIENVRSTWSKSGYFIGHKLSL